MYNLTGFVHPFVASTIDEPFLCSSGAHYEEVRRSTEGLKWGASDELDEAMPGQELRLFTCTTP